MLLARGALSWKAASIAACTDARDNSPAGRDDFLTRPLRSKKMGARGSPNVCGFGDCGAAVLLAASFYKGWV